MDFEQMQLIWDEQKERRMYALDMDALHDAVKRRARRISRGVEAMEIGMIFISIFVALFLASEPLLEGTDPEQYISAAIFLGVLAYLVGGRVRRRARDRGFEPSLRGDLDRAIAQVDYHIMRIRTMPLWFCLPAFTTIAISFAFATKDKPWWTWPLVLAAFPLSIYVARLELRCSHLPMKRDLEALRAKLTDGR
jgi:hypothetical protein